MTYQLAQIRLVPIIALTLSVMVNPVFAQSSECDARAIQKLLQKDDIQDFRTFQLRCGKGQRDIRGFSVYDRARLAGSKQILAGLKDDAQYKESTYTKALAKLIQTGLRFLNFDAGIIDGELGEHSIEAIRRYQKRYGFKVDGKLHEEWLTDFHHRLVKQTQKELNILGFNAGGADGIVGPNTITAMQAFRQERQLPSADYPEIDDQLLYQLMMMEHEINKKAIAKRDAERAARRVAQEAAKRKEIAKQREAAKKAAQKKRQEAEAAATAARKQREADEKRIAQLNEAAAANVAKLIKDQGSSSQSVPTAKQQSMQETTQQATQQQVARERIAAQKQAAAQKQQEEQARQLALKAKAAEEKAAREAAEAAKAAEKARVEANSALSAVKKDRKVSLSNEMKQATAVTGTKPAGQGFGELKGILNFSSPTSCTVAGQPIESSWCESYYPNGKGKSCTVIMSQSGLVVSFLCD